MQYLIEILFNSSDTEDTDREPQLKKKTKVDFSAFIKQWKLSPFIFLLQKFFMEKIYFCCLIFKNKQV